MLLPDRLGEERCHNAAPPARDPPRMTNAFEPRKAQTRMRHCCRATVATVLYGTVHIGKRGATSPHHKQSLVAAASSAPLATPTCNPCSCERR